MTSRSAVLADAALAASQRGDHPAAIRYAHAAAQAFNVELEAAGRGDAVAARSGSVDTLGRGDEPTTGGGPQESPLAPKREPEYGSGTSPRAAGSTAPRGTQPPTPLCPICEGPNDTGFVTCSVDCSDLAPSPFDEDGDRGGDR